jgi:peptidoglycan/xylan/chitin deacetylase (PgdA/CDA1 family)
MKMYWVKTGRFIKSLFPGFVWDMPNTQRTVYLTFDDGPTPEVTEWTLEILAQHDIKATFFCIGKNIEANPEIFAKVAAAGHSIGNHTFNHLNGWKNKYNAYIDNFDACETSINNRLDNPKKLFRPPYGKIKTAQAATVRKKGYKIIMWDVLSADFDQTITPEKCLQNVLDATCEGSIIIFHDSVKASANLRYALPRAIEKLKEKGFRFEALT